MRFTQNKVLSLTAANSALIIMERGSRDFAQIKVNFNVEARAEFEFEDGACEGGIQRDFGSKARSAVEGGVLATVRITVADKDMDGSIGRCYAGGIGGGRAADGLADVDWNVAPGLDDAVVC